MLGVVLGDESPARRGHLESRGGTRIEGRGEDEATRTLRARHQWSESIHRRRPASGRHPFRERLRRCSPLQQPQQLAPNPILGRVESQRPRPRLDEVRLQTPQLRACVLVQQRRQPSQRLGRRRVAQVELDRALRLAEEEPRPEAVVLAPRHGPDRSPQSAKHVRLHQVREPIIREPVIDPQPHSERRRPGSVDRELQRCPDLEARSRRSGPTDARQPRSPWPRRRPHPGQQRDPQQEVLYPPGNSTSSVSVDSLHSPSTWPVARYSVTRYR